MKKKTRKVDDCELQKITGGSDYTSTNPTGGGKVCTPERPSGGSLPLDTDARRTNVGDEEPGDFGR